jgi:hypothetical protein
VRRLIRKPSPSMIVAIVALVAALAGTAYAAHKINGKKLKNKSVAAKKIKNHALSCQQLTTDACGKEGPQGPKGDTGNTGATGPAGQFVGPHWSIIDRNTIGSAVAQLEQGPFVPNSSPPHGNGSLHLATSNDAVSGTPAPPPAEKIAFGNEVDFQGNPVSSLNQVGFWVYTTGENVDAGQPMPNITLEINPHVAGKTFTSMVYSPAASTANQWSDYIDGTATPPSGFGWYFTNGSVASATSCGQGAGQHFCSLSEAKQALVDHNDSTGAATVYTVAVGKGRDSTFSGDVDALRLGLNGQDHVYDFEADGTHTESP